MHSALHERMVGICTLVVQVAHSPYSGFMHCLRHTVEKRGVKALFKSYPTTVNPQLTSWPAQSLKRSLSSLCLSSAVLSWLSSVLPQLECEHRWL